MLKPPLLYASPFPPMQSGIAEYSRMLVSSLREFFDITLLVEPQHVDSLKLAREFKVLAYRPGQVDFDRFPYRIYNIGNNPWFHGHIYEACLQHPGVVILHDAINYFLVVGIYRDQPCFYSKVYELEGPAGVAIIKGLVKDGQDLLQFSEPQRLPFLRELATSRNRFLVHSEYTRRFLGRYSNYTATAQTFNMVDSRPGGPPACNRAKVLERAGIPSNAVVVASLGFIAPTKLNHLACEAIRRVNLKAARPVYYLMVGEGAYVDHYLDEFIHKTGYVSEKEFDEYLACADLVVNLRYPSMGETSAALLQALSFAKPCIVTNHAWFSELPENSVIKVPPNPPEVVIETLIDTIQGYLRDPSGFAAMGLRALEYVRSEHAPERVARQVWQFVTNA